MERSETDRLKFISAAGTVIDDHPYPIWEDDGPGYCFKLVQTMLRSRYLRDGDSLQPLRKHEEPPERVCVVTSEGRVICEWSVQEELRLMARQPRHGA